MPPVPARYLVDYAAYEALYQNNMSPVGKFLFDAAYRPTLTSRLIVGTLTLSTVVGMYVVGKWAYDKVV